MTDRALDDLACRVLLDVIGQEYGDAIKELPEHDFFPSFEKKMKKLIHRADHPIRYRVAQAAACILLAALLSGCAVLAISPEARAAVTRWVVEWYEPQIIYRYTGEAITEAMPRYEISELPEGYVEAENERIEESNFVSIVYRDSETGKTLYLEYIYMQQGSAIAFVTEDAEIEPTKVNGLDGQLLFTDDWENKQSTVTWVDPDKNIQFSLSAHLSNSDILRAAESVYLVES